MGVALNGVSLSVFLTFVGVGLALFSLSFLLGFILSHFLKKQKNELEKNFLVSEHQRQLLHLDGQMNGLYKEQQEMKERFNQKQSAYDELMEKYIIEKEQKGAAEEKAKKIIELQKIHLEREIKLEDLQGELNLLKNEKVELQIRLDAERSALVEQRKTIEESKKTLQDTFKALSSDTLKENSQIFLNLAKQTLEKINQETKGDVEKRQQSFDSAVKPIKETLDKFEQKMGDLEKARTEAYSGITVHFQTMKETQERLKTETSNLVKALRAPQVRGRWGEIQLKRVVEIAGMLDHCDFYEQTTVTDVDEGRLRPDLLIKLPGNKNIVVDSKAVINSYLEAAQSDDEDFRKIKLLEHAKHIRSRIAELSKKSYWDQFENSPEFVVLFLPGEVFFSAALENDPTLIEQSLEQKVILATPTTLIALLKAAAYGWKQSVLAENAKEISNLGKELHKRVLDMSSHFSTLGSRLSGAIESYNKTLGSIESRVLVTTRKFQELNVTDSSSDIENLIPIDKSPRGINF